MLQGIIISRNFSVYNTHSITKTEVIYKIQPYKNIFLQKEIYIPTIPSSKNTYVFRKKHVRVSNKRRTSF